MLEVKNISVKYKKQIGVTNISFEATHGEIIGLIGADGAGKTSTLLSIAGVNKFSGEIVYDGVAYHSPKESEKLKHKIGLMPQGLGLVLYDELTVGEHFDFFRDIRGVKKDEEYENRLLKMAGLSRFLDREAGHLSGGMRQKLSLILTLLHKPKLLILDEPTTGVDPLSRIELWEIIDQMRKEENIIALISTAYMEEAEKMDKILLFDNHSIIAVGTSDELIETAKDYTYKNEIECENCFSFNKRTYSITPLDLEKEMPTLESLFFVNYLKKNKTIPKISIVEKESNENIPEIIMESKALTKIFGTFVADDSIDMELRRGEILGLLGGNGAGKTTFIKMLLGLYPIDKGELTLLNKKIESYEDRLSLKSKIGYVSQRFALYNDMTLFENMLYFANMHKIPVSKAYKKIEQYSKMLGFSEYMSYLPKELPLGINQRFSIAVALLHEPVVLFLDEPTSGVDTIARAQFWKLLKELKERWNIAILITTHYMSEAEYCDRVVVLKDGKKIADDSVGNLHKQNPEAKNFEDIFVKFYKDN